MNTNKKFVLFGAVKAVTYGRKGFKYILDALEFIKAKNNLTTQIELIIFGAEKLDEIEIPFKTHFLGNLKTNDELINAFNLADVFITPSLEDNLPLTVMEALACGIPVVGFETGGIPEMIDHKQNGYVARSRSAEDLAEGILWVLEDDLRYNELTKNARLKVEKEYSYPLIAQKHNDLYNSL